MRKIGYSAAAVDAVWPEWWSAEAALSPSARTSLRFTVAQRLGIKPSTLLGDGDPTFTWYDATRFKNLGATTRREQEILSSFTASLAQRLSAASPTSPHIPASIQAADLRRFLDSPDLTGVLTTCWALGIPVIQTRVFPLAHKRMHAATACSNGRHAIIVGQETRFPAKAAFTIAHELAHIFLGHTQSAPAFLDVEDPSQAKGDSEELAANTYALELLTGDPDLVLEATAADYNAPTLANAAREAGRANGIDPGMIILSFAYQHSDWARATAALRLLGELDVTSLINDLARNQLLWSRLHDDDVAFISAALGQAP